MSANTYTSWHLHCTAHRNYCEIDDDPDNYHADNYHADNYHADNYHTNDYHTNDYHTTNHNRPFHHSGSDDRHNNELGHQKVPCVRQFAH